MSCFIFVITSLPWSFSDSHELINTILVIIHFMYCIYMYMYKYKSSIKCDGEIDKEVGGERESSTKYKTSR